MLETIYAMPACLQKLVLARGRDAFDAVWFGAKDAEDALPIAAGQRLRAAYTIGPNAYRGVTRLQLQIKAIEGPVAGCVPTTKAQAYRPTVAAMGT